MRLTIARSRRCAPRCSARSPAPPRSRNSARCAPSPTRCCRIPIPPIGCRGAARRNHWGYSPLTRGQQAQRRATPARVDAAARARRAGRHAARARRRDVLSKPERHHASHRRGDRRSHLGIPAAGAGRQQRLHPVSVDQPQSRDLRQLHSRQRRRQLRVRARRAKRARSRGKRRSWTIAAARSTARGRSSRTARSSRAAAASRRAARKRAC